MDIDEANINDLDDYIQYYYEENIDHKIEATRKILLLTLDMKNIEILLNHGISHLKIINILIYLNVRFINGNS